MDFADKTATINKMLKKDAQFIWTDACQEAFESIKQSILENQKLYWLDYERKIYFRCDASKIGCGAQLFQHDENGRELPVAYISHTFSQAEQNWSTLEQELFAAVWSTKTWMSQLEGAHFTILTDHKNILQLQKSTAAVLCNLLGFERARVQGNLELEGEAQHGLCALWYRVHRGGLW